MAKKLDSLSPRKATPKTEAKPAEATPAAAPVEVITPTKAAEAKPETKPEAGEQTTAPASPEATETAPADPNTPATPESGDTFESMFPEPTVSVTRPPALILWALLLIASVAVAAVGYKLINPRLDTWLSVASTPTPSPTATPTATVTPSASPTASTTPTATPVATATPTPTPSGTATPTAKSAITLRVLNGTHESGAAGTAKTTLTKAGFTVRTVGNAKQQNYEKTMIYYQSGHKAEAEQVNQALASYKATLEESSLASPDMVLVVIGSN